MRRFKKCKETVRMDLRASRYVQDLQTWAFDLVEEPCLTPAEVQPLKRCGLERGCSYTGTLAESQALQIDKIS